MRRRRGLLDARRCRLLASTNSRSERNEGLGAVVTQRMVIVNEAHLGHACVGSSMRGFNDRGARDGFILYWMGCMRVVAGERLQD